MLTNKLSKTLLWLFERKYTKCCLGAVGVVLLLFSAYHLYFAHRIIPGVYVGAEDLGGLTSNRAHRVLEEAGAENNKILTLTTGDYTFNVTAADIELEYDWRNTIARAFEVGRTGNIVVDTKDKLKGLIKPVPLNAFYTFNEDLLSQKIAQIQAEVAQPSESASFILTNGRLEIKPSRFGTAVYSSELYKMLIAAFDKVAFGVKELPIEQDIPEILETELLTVQEEVASIIAQDLAVIYEDTVWTLPPEQQLEFLRFKKDANAKLEIRLNEDKFEAYLDELKLAINTTPKGEVMQLDGDKVLDFRIIETGVAIDEKAFTEAFKTALFDKQPEVAVSVVATGGSADASDYGIYAVLGEGMSHYYGSAAGRVHNLNLAAERTNGVLVPPDAVYSFNEAVGAISAATGYDTAYIISNGRTILGEGGGVCQTSTTLFRAILDAGLPIVSRHPHAYRVSYYEYDKPVGFDASIFQPSLDLKFKNDTPNYVLIQAYSDRSQSMLAFKIFGTPDGRTVEISDPVITNVTPPPEPLYKDDPTLPEGTVKQIDFAAWGANVSFTRVVKRSGEVLYEDVFSSRYQPWQAVYLKGTKKN